MSKSSLSVGTILHHFVHGPQGSSSDRPIRADEREFLGRVDRITEEHLADPLFTTANAAEYLGISRMHLNRRLRILTGQSTHQLLQEKRLECAREILVTESLSVAAIAGRVGFRSTSHFTTAFRLKYGAPPGEYRRQNPEAFPPPPSHT